MKIDFYKYFFISLICFWSVACSSPSMNGYTDEPMDKPVFLEPQDVSFEVKLTDDRGQAINGIEIRLVTDALEDLGVTNSEGVTRVIGKRQAGEPLVFKFSGKGLKATRTIRSIPNSLKDAALVFEMVNDRYVRFSHYNVAGLYR